jgi:uncharacterized protein (DUF952 family)
MNVQEPVRPSIVMHMLPRTRWEAQPSNQPYRGDTLSSEGFIHCTAEASALVDVANTHYRREPGDWVILMVDTTRVSAPVRWEAADGRIFPHVYGPIEMEAVVQVLDFPRTSAGHFTLPPGLAQAK